jgi:hypothetical protein
MPVLSGPAATFKLVTSDLPPLEDDQVLLKILYLSNDPAQRGWISKDLDPKRLYVPPVAQGACMRAWGISEIVESKSSKLSKGTLVTATVCWAEYAVLNASDCMPIPEVPGLSPTHFLGAFGITGLTAYYGLKTIVKAGPADTVVVSGAAGATGSMVVQIAKKILGCKRVIGIAGTDEKCQWVESLGADICLNYKAPDFKESLINATEGFIEVYFDNVGGEILDLMVTRMARYGRIAACGAISGYNDSRSVGLRNYVQVITMRLEIKGFVVLDFTKERDQASAAVQELIQALKEKRIILGEENEMVISPGFEGIPETWMKLFEGGNKGKLVTKL